ncbi:Ig-like domain-containing protein, partial [Salmonella enterica subsp. enterica serovar Kentucky]|nr:Ig-like domain-containing protein [Salmonella enterica subsp. enterica serovar Kentucky]
PDAALADGSYTFTVTVTDVAGNQQTSAPLKVTIDGTLTTPVMALFGSIIAINAYMYLIRNVSPALATSYAYVNPVVAVLLGTGL